MSVQVKMQVNFQVQVHFQVQVPSVVYTVQCVGSSWLPAKDEDFAVEIG